MYNIVIQYFYTWHDHSQSNYHLLSHIVIIILLTRLPILYIKPCVICNFKFAPLNPLHLFCPFPAPNLSGNHLFVFWVCFCFYVHLFFHLCTTQVKSHGNWLSVWLISLTRQPSRSTHIVTNGKILFLFMAEGYNIV